MRSGTCSHYNDYRYVEEDDAFENLEDGHNIIEAFTRDLLSNYNGCPDLSFVCCHRSRDGWKGVTGRVGVVVITLASHARGREFNPRIRYFSLHLSSVSIVFIVLDFFPFLHCFGWFHCHRHDQWVSELLYF